MWRCFMRCTFLRPQNEIILSTCLARTCTVLGLITPLIPQLETWLQRNETTPKYPRIIMWLEVTSTWPLSATHLILTTPFIRVFQEFVSKELWKKIKMLKNFKFRAFIYPEKLRNWLKKLVYNLDRCSVALARTSRKIKTYILIIFFE